METTIEKLKQSARDSWSGETGEQRAVEIESFIRRKLTEYSSELGVSEADLLEAMEKRRDYSAISYYQEATFPRLEDVHIFETMDELSAAIPSRTFRCPSCEEISYHPYECSQEECDWKSYGLLRTLGKGFRFTVKEGFLERPVIDEIFMPIEFWAKPEEAA